MNINFPALPHTNPTEYSIPSIEAPAAESEKFQEIPPESQSTITSSAEKSFWEKEKEILKLTAIDALISGTVFAITLPYYEKHFLHYLTSFWEGSSRSSHAPVVAYYKGMTLGAVFAVRQLNLFFSEGIQRTINTENVTVKPFIKIGSIINHFVPPFLLALVNIAPIINLAHEYGHYFAYRYVNPSLMPKVHLYPLGGQVLPNFPPFSRDLTDFEWGIVSGAGPAVDMAITLALTATTHFQKESYFRTVLKASICERIVTSFAYAYNGLDTTTRNIGDYAGLWKMFGIHPYVSMATIVALPAILKAGLMYYDYHSKQKEASTENVENIKAENVPNSLL
jgi:hypothetical protein